MSYDFLYLQEQALTIKQLQQLLGGFSHYFWYLLKYCDSAPFYLILLGLFCSNWSVRPLKYILLFAAVALSNRWFKILADAPRPGAFDAQIDLIQLGSHWGLPSGAATAALILGLLIMRFVPGKMGFILGLLYCLLVSFSRVYLGVHFFTDIIAGWIIGGFIYFIFISLEDLTFRVFLPRWFPGIFVPILGALFYLQFPHHRTIELFALATAATIGSYAVPRYFPSFLGFTVVTLGTSLLIVVFNPYPVFLMFAIGLWITVGMSQVASKLTRLVPEKMRRQNHV